MRQQAFVLLPETIQEWEDEEEEAQVAIASDWSWLRRRSPALVVALVLAAAVLVTLFLRGASSRSPATAEPIGLWTSPLLNQDVVNNTKCDVPKDFCATHPNREDSLSWKDCDGDGILDPYCEGAELLRFGYISSRQNCENTWPNGLCTRMREPGKDQGEFSTKKAAGNEITIIHFNDVYQLSGVMQKNVRRGGMSRAAHVINEERKRNPDRTFVVFAGDLLSPSVLSDLFEGHQMVDILNSLKLDAASLGNHEFDFGVDILAKRVSESKFPWLNTNIMDEKGQLINGTKERLIKDVPFVPAWSKENKQTRVCLFGAAYDVRETMFKDKERITYSDIFESAEKEATHLKEDENCNVVLALTHQFSKDDCETSKRLGKKVDLILGGHDHSTEWTSVCGHAPYVKSDSDLKTQWVMTLWLNDDGTVESVDGRLLSLTDVDPFDNAVHAKILEWETKGEAEMGKTIGCSAVDLDGLDAHSRQQETALGNFFTDATRTLHGTDVALINGGTIRGNKLYSKGDLTKAKMTAMHPFGNAIVKIHATGKELMDYLELTLECYEKVCGSFVQISGLKYTFDSTAEAGHRLKSLSRPSGDAVSENDELTVAMSDYMLANSPLKHNKLFDMTILNDAVPIVIGLFEGAKRAGAECINPKIEGRIVDVGV